MSESVRLLAATAGQATAFPTGLLLVGVVLVVLLIMLITRLWNR